MLEMRSLPHLASSRVVTVICDFLLPAQLGTSRRPFASPGECFDPHEAPRRTDPQAALPTEPISVRVADAIKLTGIPRSTLYELIAAGAIDTVKIGRSTFILYASLKRLFEKS